MVARRDGRSSRVVQAALVSPVTSFQVLKRLAITHGAVAFTECACGKPAWSRDQMATASSVKAAGSCRLGSASMPTRLLLDEFHTPAQDPPSAPARLTYKIKKRLANLSYDHHSSSGGLRLVLDQSDNRKVRFSADEYVRCPR